MQPYQPSSWSVRQMGVSNIIICFEQLACAKNAGSFLLGMRSQFHIVFSTLIFKDSLDPPFPFPILKLMRKQGHAEDCIEIGIRIFYLKLVRTPSPILKN